MSMVLLFAAVLAVKIGSPEREILRVSLLLDETPLTLTGWQGGDDTLYFSLPAGADFGSAELVPTGRITVGERVLRDPTPLSEFEKDRVYVLRSGGRDCGKVVFTVSEGAAAVFVDTQSGNANYIHAAKSNKEKANVRVFSESGRLEYDGSRWKDAFRGHGNSTWNYDKKAYNLYLSSAAALTGGGESEKYVLLANAIDRSNLRNTLVYELANQVTGVWNPRVRYTELYLDGEYQGLYLLTDKVEVSEQKLNLEPGDILLNFEQTLRAKRYAIAEVTPDVSAEIIYPENLTDTQVTALGEKIHSVFDGILTKQLTQTQLQASMDLDSWAKLYLIQEVSANFDSASCSLYFYLHDGKLYAGPVWDYDNTFGVRTEFGAKSFYAQEKGIWKGLMQYPAFSDRVKRIYAGDFREKLEAEFTVRSEEISTRIGKAAALNELRWADMELGGLADSNRAQLMHFYTERLRFLDRAWLKNVRYHTIAVECEDNPTVYYSVRHGYRLRKTEAITAQLEEGIVWYDRDSDAAFDFNKRIRRDYTLTACFPESDAEAGGTSHLQWVRDNMPEAAAIALCVTAVLAAAAMCWVDVKRNGGTDGRT